MSEIAQDIDIAQLAITRDSKNRPYVEVQEKVRIFLQRPASGSTENPPSIGLKAYILLQIDAPVLGWCWVRHLRVIQTPRGETQLWWPRFKAGVHNLDYFGPSQPEQRRRIDQLILSFYQRCQQEKL